MEEVSHRGRVISVNANGVRVEIVSSSACAGCHAKNLCGLSENVSKEVLVRTADAGSFSVGEEVEVLLAASMGQLAVLISYVVPLILTVAVLLILSALVTNEFVAGLCGIAAGALWYFVVWLNRGKLKQSFDFKLRKL